MGPCAQSPGAPNQISGFARQLTPAVSANDFRRETSSLGQFHCLGKIARGDFHIVTALFELVTNGRKKGTCGEFARSIQMRIVGWGSLDYRSGDEDSSGSANLQVRKADPVPASSGSSDIQA